MVSFVWIESEMPKQLSTYYVPGSGLTTGDTKKAKTSPALKKLLV